ncbi:MAG: nucleotidyltransferase domain-containing protein [Bacteroidia bacterium]
MFTCSTKGITKAPVTQDFTLLQARQPANLLFEATSGSHAYGLATDTSDIDIRGIFVLPRKRLYGLEYTQQVNDNKNDISLYELGRFSVWPSPTTPI